MKGLTYGISTVLTSLALLGMLFKIMHWPGAGIMLIAGVAGWALIGVPVLAIYKYRSAA